MLFLGVAQWLGCTTTTQMRYKDEGRRFWHTGYRLFRGKFLNIMAGHKNVGQVVTGTTEKGSYEPSSSKINFAVPDVKYLRGGKKIPAGINDDLLKVVAKSDPGDQSFKLCFDGKKLNAGKTSKGGDVDLFGHEPKPTLPERKARLAAETDEIQSLSEFIETLDIHGDSNKRLSQLSASEAEELKRRDVIKCSSLRDEERIQNATNVPSKLLHVFHSRRLVYNGLRRKCARYGMRVYIFHQHVYFCIFMNDT